MDNRLLAALQTHGQNFIPTILLHQSNFIMLNGTVIKNRTAKPWYKQLDHAVFINIDDDGRKFICLVGWNSLVDMRLIDELKFKFVSYDFV